MIANTLQGLQGVSITVNTATAQPCKGVYIGTAQTLDFSFDGSTWITFQGVIAGSILPIRVKGARKNAGSAAPSAGDIVFLY